MRQYVGARYVPKIYQNSQDPNSCEWEDVAFEYLTIVSFQNNSYLSRKDVPAGVGNPSVARSYWAQTGFYNGQIAHLQQQVADIYSIISPVTEYGISEDNTAADNTTAILAIPDGTPLFFPAGEYHFNSMDFDHIRWILDNEAVLICDEECDAFISLYKDKVHIEGVDDYSHNNYIIGGVINCASKAERGIAATGFRRFTIERVTIKNFTIEGINSRYSPESTFNHGAGLSVINCWITNTDLVGTNTTTGINDNGGDNFYSNIEIVDCPIGCQCKSSTFEALHPWLSKQSLYPNSVAFKIMGSFVDLTDCICDTMETGVLFPGDYAKVAITNFQMYSNTSVTPASYLANYVQSFIKAAEIHNQISVNGALLSFYDEPAKVVSDNIYATIASRVSYAAFAKMTGLMINGGSQTTNVYPDIQATYEIAEVDVLRKLEKDVDFDTVVMQGTYAVDTYHGTGGDHWPVNATTGIMHVFKTGAWVSQLFLDGEHTAIYYRNSTNTGATWTAWRSIT